MREPMFPEPAETLSEEGLARLRERAEAFLQELNRGYYEALAGHRESPGLDRIYALYADLFEPGRAAEVRRALAAASDPDEARRLSFLREFVLSGLEEEAGKEAEERYLVAEANAVLRVGGEEVPFRATRVRLRNSPDQDRRREIARAAVEVSRSLQPHLLEGVEAAHSVARGQAGGDYVAYRAELSGVDFPFLLEETRRLLEETEAAYADLFGYFARRELGLERAQVAFWDLPRLFRGGQFDSAFQPGAMMGNVGAMVGAMGLDMSAGGNVEFDMEPRPRKSSRAFCSPIRIPHEVKLVILPSGGADDYRAFLHELGHSLHFGYVDPAAPFEYRALGDNSVTECYAGTFDHLLLLPGWLRDVQGLAQPRDFLLLQWFEEIYMLRRYSAKLRYELALHAQGPAPPLAERYKEELRLATGVEAPPERYLEDLDARFYCVCYLQAWMLCGLLHRALRERFDSDWYLNPRTGPFLKGLFERGQRELPNELADLLGVGELGFGALLEWLREGLEGARGG